MLNEAAALRFIAKNTDIPVPKVHACFEDEEALLKMLYENEALEGCDVRQCRRDKKSSMSNRALVQCMTPSPQVSPARPGACMVRGH